MRHLQWIPLVGIVVTIWMKDQSECLANSNNQYVFVGSLLYQSTAVLACVVALILK